MYGGSPPSSALREDDAYGGRTSGLSSLEDDDTYAGGGSSSFGLGFVFE